MSKQNYPTHNLVQTESLRIRSRSYSPKPLFIERMQELLPNEKDFNEYMEILKKSPVNSIRCNNLKISVEELKKRIEAKNWKIKQPFKDYPEIMIVEGKFAEATASDNYNKLVNKKLNEIDNNSIKMVDKVKDYINNKKIFANKNEQVIGVVDQISGGQLISLAPGELGRALEHILGYYYIQEISSMLPVLVLDPKPGEKVLDLCASPGSKTTQIAARMNNQGLIIANEVKLDRVKILSANLERCGVMNVILTRRDGIALCNKFEKEKIFFDKILVDAPCSGEGTIRSSPKTFEMWNIKTVEYLSKLQKALISSAIKILKPNGTLIYSTCTHSPEEDEEIIDFALRNFKDIKIEKIELPVKMRKGITKWKEKEYIEDVKLSCRIYPQDNNTEGFFLAKIRRLK